jgi:hypothetical protein
LRAIDGEIGVRPAEERSEILPAAQISRFIVACVTSPDFRGSRCKVILLF